MLARIGLPTSHDRVHVERVELEPEATPACALRGDHAWCPLPRQSVEHNVAAGGAVQDGVGHHPHALRRRMHAQQVALLGERARTRIHPHVGAIAAVLAEQDIVAVRRATVLVNEDEFVAAAIEGAHAGVVLDPHAEVLELGVNLPTSGQNL